MTTRLITYRNTNANLRRPPSQLARLSYRRPGRSQHGWLPTIGRRPTKGLAALGTTHKVPFDIDSLATMPGVHTIHV